MSDEPTPPDSPGPPPAEPSADEPLPTSYGEAVAELEAILADIERHDVDVDELAPRVRRAAVLIRVCRGHIGAARVDIERIVADLDALDLGGD